MPKGTPKDPRNNKRRGFASMSPERRKELAALGGKSVPPEKRTFRRHPEIAAAAGRTYRKEPKE